MKKRDNTIDVLKGIGIILVVIGHMDTSQIGGGIISYIYSFHMPLFFWISGYLMYSSKSIKFKEFFIKKFRTIIIPYIIFFVVSIFYGHIIVRYIFKQYVIVFNLKDTLKALFLSSDWLNSVPTFNFPLWFLMIFFITVIVFYFLDRIQKISIFIIVLFLLSIITIPIQKYIEGRPAFSINVLPASLTFMGIGYLFRKYEDKIKINPISLFLMFTFTLWSSYMYPENIQGIKHYIYFVSATASILIYYYIAKDISGSKLLQYIGQNSLIILGTHMLFSYSYQFTFIKKFFSQYWDGVIIFIINLIYILVLCLIISYLINFIKTYKVKMIIKKYKK